MTISRKHQAFIDSYFLHNLNATAAYCDVYGAGSGARANAARLIATDSISAEIKRRLEENTMKANEVISRLSEHARGDIGDFLDISSMGFTVNLSKADRLGKTSLIKELRQKVTTIVTKAGDEVETIQTEIKLQDQQAALALLAKYHGLLVDRTDVTNHEPVRLVEVVMPPDEASHGGD